MAGFGRRERLLAGIAGLLAAAALALCGANGATAAEGAHTSIVGGQTTSIAKWPWHVAFLESKVKRPKAKPSKRYVCGGSLIAPTIVITATHCAMEIDLSKPRYFSVVGGRTRLDDESQGQEVLVKEAWFPLTRSGAPRYLMIFDARWDVAVLELEEPIDQPTIKLAGPDEMDLIAPGRVIVKTGWGLHEEGAEGELSPVLRKAKTVVQPPKACDFEGSSDLFGFAFDPGSQVCLGSPTGRATSCYGDSGGPAVARSSDGYRLFGATSYGTDIGCAPSELSVDAAVARHDTRAWIAGIALERTGIDVVGSGGTTGPLPKYCEVPKIERLKLAKARRLIRKAGCSVGKIREIPIPHRKKLRRFDDVVIATRDYPFALRERGYALNMVVAQWQRENKRER